MGKKKADDIFLSQPIDSVLHNWTWSEVALESRKMAAYLLSLNLPKKVRLVYCLKIVRIG